MTNKEFGIIRIGGLSERERDEFYFVTKVVVVSKRRGKEGYLSPLKIPEEVYTELESKAVFGLRRKLSRGKFGIYNGEGGFPIFPKIVVNRFCRYHVDENEYSRGYKREGDLFFPSVLVKGIADAYARRDVLTRETAKLAREGLFVSGLELERIYSGDIEDPVLDGSDLERERMLEDSGEEARRFYGSTCRSRGKLTRSRFRRDRINKYRD